MLRAAGALAVAAFALLAGAVGHAGNGRVFALKRLADGRDRTLATTKGLIDAQITPAGAFYAADVAAGRALVAYVPMRDARRKLQKSA